MIELMIVVAIIGILAAVAMPVYQNHIMQAQVGSGFDELSTTKPSAEAAIVEGVTPSLNPADKGFVGMHNAAAQYCTLALVHTPGATTTITCTLKNVNAKIVAAGGSLILTRDVEGRWSCATSGIDNAIKPSACL